MEIEPQSGPPRAPTRSCRTIRLAKTTATAAIAAVGLYLLVLAFPEPLFAHSVTYGNFRLYSRSPLEADARPILDEVNRRISRSEINEPGLTHRVFILETPAWYAFFNGPYRRAIGRNCEVGNAIFLPSLDARAGRVVHFDGRSADAAAILAHECVHTLIQRRLGLIRAIRLPLWKKEGYAEYIGFDEQRGDPEPEPELYRKARLRWKSLFETQALTFDQVIASPD